MDYIKLLLLALDLIKRFTVWMERKELISLGEANQIKANMEASQNVLDTMLKARADSAANRTLGRVPDNDPDNRDL